MLLISFPAPCQVSSICPFPLHCCFHLFFGMTLFLAAVSHTLWCHKIWTLCFLEMLGVVSFLFCHTSLEIMEAWGKCVKSVNWKLIPWHLQPHGEDQCSLSTAFNALGNGRLDQMAGGNSAFLHGYTCESCSIAPSHWDLSSVT